MKKSIAVFILALLCSCSFLFPNTQNLSQLKSDYNQYVTLRNDNADPQKILELRASILKNADKLEDNSPRDSLAGLQAHLVECLVKLESEPLSAEDVASLRKVVASDSLKGSEPWFYGMAYAVVGVYFANTGEYLVSEGAFKKAIFHDDIPTDVRAYALANYVNAIFNRFTQDESALTQKLTSLLEDLDEAGMGTNLNNPELLLVLAQINSNLGNDSASCEYAKSVILLGAPNPVQEREAQDIVATDCSN